MLSGNSWKFKIQKNLTPFGRTLYKAFATESTRLCQCRIKRYAHQTAINHKTNITNFSHRLTQIFADFFLVPIWGNLVVSCFFVFFVPFVANPLHYQFYPVIHQGTMCLLHGESRYDKTNRTLSFGNFSHKRNNHLSGLINIPDCFRIITDIL